MKTQLIASIKELEYFDFECEQGKGTSYDIYFDPECCKIYCFYNGGGDQPESAYYNIDKFIVSARNAIPSSVVTALLELEEIIDRIWTAYKGTRQDFRNNFVGVWDYGEISAEDIDRQIMQKLIDTPIVAYCDAQDWFDDLKSLKDSWTKGLSPEEAIEEEYLGNEIEGACSKNDAVAYATNLWERWDGLK